MPADSHHQRRGSPRSLPHRFFEKYGTHGKMGGTGLGTYSAMMAARAPGGTIHLHCSDGRTTVTVELPKSSYTSYRFLQTLPLPATPLRFGLPSPWSG
ncbi:MAG: ATP-binding protein [Trichloromonas sp.]|jgi:nitrogen-specific signal transduction histidine kinase|nr:ATP-binding protein [Trichloromonas sp.]